MKKTALIVAGGKGERMNSIVPKQFITVNDLPILMHTIKQFSSFNKIILVLHKEKIKFWKELCQQYSFSIKHEIVVGGIDRYSSVKNGLNYVDDNCVVAIHDGARPLISSNLISKLIIEVKKNLGVIPVVYIKESVRQKINLSSSKIIDRSDLVLVQTPQCFFGSEIKQAYVNTSAKGFTDDASVFEASSGKILLIAGEETNIKITKEEDLKIAKAFMN